MGAIPAVAAAQAHVAGSPRVLVVECDGIAPAPSTSGNRVVRWGLLSGLAQCGAAAGFYSAADAGEQTKLFLDARDQLCLRGRFWFNRPAVGGQASAALREAIEGFRPDLVLALGPQALALVRSSATPVLTGLVSIDLEFLPILYRHLFNLRFGLWSQKLKSLARTPRVLLSFAQTRASVVRLYPQADFIVNHAAHHARWHERHGPPVLYAPNPLAAVEAPPSAAPPAKPRFLLLGGLGGIATLTGIAFFARQVYPHLAARLERGDIEIHLIGRGRLDPAFDRAMPALVRRAHVAELSAEFAGCTAVLVPTPIRLGFRTRILDAFRHGRTAVAHVANAAGMPELQDGHNALLAAEGRAFAAAIMRLADDPALADRLGAHAYRDFDEALSARHVVRRILDFAQSAAYREAA